MTLKLKQDLALLIEANKSLMTLQQIMDNNKKSELDHTSPLHCVPDVWNCILDLRQRLITTLVNDYPELTFAGSIEAIIQEINDTKEKSKKE